MMDIKFYRIEHFKFPVFELYAWQEIKAILS